MDIIEELVLEVNGSFKKSDINRGFTATGLYISENNSGFIKKEDYSIKIDGFYNLGARAGYTLDGSPFKISLILPFILKDSISVFPKTFFQKIIGDSIPTKTLSDEVKLFLKKYKIMGSKNFVSSFLLDSYLPKTVSNHILYISTNHNEKFSSIALRPNESVITIDEIREIYNIVDKLGAIIIRNNNNNNND